MKLGPVTKLNKRKTAASKKLAMMSYHKIGASLSFLQFMAIQELVAIRKPVSGHMVYKTYFD